jgi:hypothetical protein
MYSLISLMMAAERARDLRSEAARAQLGREARQARRAQRARRASSIVPDSYEDFLCQTARSAMREPTAAGRATGQPVR